MAARRLLIVMVVLLAISTLAAALVPPPPEETETTTTATRPTSPERERPTGGELVREEVAVRGAQSAPKRIEVEPGDQLSLVVTSGEPGEASIPDFGLIEFAGPGNPARFDVLADRAGRFPVQFQGAGEIATIEVAREARAPARQRDRR